MFNFCVSLLSPFKAVEHFYRFPFFWEKTPNNFIDAVKHSTNVTTDVVNRKKIGEYTAKEKNERKKENNKTNEKAYIQTNEQRAVC